VNKASDFLGNFSRLLRSSLESSREDYILLEDEINSMKNYLELQQLRYENKFVYSIDVDEDIDLEGAIITPMLIQPFIENAIEHGIRHKKDNGNINIRFKLDHNKITCEIEDDGVGREKAWETEYAKKGKHKSLANEIIRDRIKILNRKFKQKISLSITDLKSEADEAIGTMVRLDLPYLLD
jgi:LytS/YehU family sensor histidine kinase